MKVENVIFENNFVLACNYCEIKFIKLCWWPIETAWTYIGFW